MKNTYTFNSGLDHRTECDAVINSINKLIRYETGARSVSHAKLKALLKYINLPVVINNAYRGNNCGEDFDLYIDSTTTINIYWDLSIYIYAYKDEDIHNKSGFSFVVEKYIDPSSTDKLPSVTGVEPAEVRTAKEPVVKEPEFIKAAKNSNSKPKNDEDVVKRMLKAREYFVLNKIFTDDFNDFINVSIVPLTEHLKNIRDYISKEVISQSGNSLFGNLTVEEIDEYIKPFSYLITLIDIEEPEKAAYMIKSAFNAMLLAHMDAKLNGYDEDLHIEYNVNTK